MNNWWYWQAETGGKRMQLQAEAERLRLERECHSLPGRPSLNVWAVLAALAGGRPFVYPAWDFGAGREGTRV